MVLVVWLVEIRRRLIVFLATTIDFCKIRNDNLTENKLQMLSIR